MKSLNLDAYSLRIVVLITSLFALFSCASSYKAPFDVVIQNAFIIDGTGSSGYSADIGLRGDTIAFIGQIDTSLTETIVDAKGSVVCPGFIDLHSHAERGVLREPNALHIVTQGVTTILGGNCGGSRPDIALYFEQLSSQGVAVNVALLAGHNTIRRQVMGRENRPATTKELGDMKNLLAQAMRDGAFGLSSGLIYIPGAFAPPEELNALAQVVNEHQGFYATHMRSEGGKVLEALEVALLVAKSTGVPLHISHHKTAGPSAWGLSKRTLFIMDEHIDNGYDLTLDQYPYEASNTNLGVLLPAWSLEGGAKGFEKRIQNATLKRQILQESEQIISRQRADHDLSRIQISRYDHNPRWEGRKFKDVLLERNLPPTTDEAAKLAVEKQLNGGGRGIYFTMREDDIKRTMRHPKTSIASDGTGITWQKGSPHPRNYGIYPRCNGLMILDTFYA